MCDRSQVVKAGWLFRQSSFLHRWKRNWFTLSSDGLLRYFESQDSSRAEEVYLLYRDCCRIVTGSEVQCTPPENSYQGKSCMFELKMTNGDNLYLCAESADDMKAWQVALEQARAYQATVPHVGATPVGAYGYAPPMHVAYQQTGPMFGGYPGQVISTATPQVIHTTDGRTTVINQAPPTQVVYMEEPHEYRYRHRYGNRRRYNSNPVYMTTRYYY